MLEERKDPDFVVIHFAIGVALAVLLRYGADELNKHLTRVGADTGIPNWMTFTVPPTRALLALLPGFVSGWVASRRELLCGFLTGLLGSILPSLLFGTFGRLTPADAPSEVFFATGWLLSIGVGGGLFGAAAAATAQLLRSNHRWRGP